MVQEAEERIMTCLLEKMTLLEKRVQGLEEKAAEVPKSTKNTNNDEGNSKSNSPNMTLINTDSN